MTITVNIQDGPSLQFPDDTPQDVIHQSVLKYTQPMVSYGTGLGRAAADLPILGPLAQRLNAATMASVEPLTRRIGGKNTGGPDDPTISHVDDWLSRFNEDLEMEKARDEQFRLQNPKASLGAHLAGGVAAGAALAPTTVGSTVLGLGGRTLPGMMVRGGASGAGISAADAAIRSGGDPDAIKSAAITGGAVGTATPAVASVVSPLVSRLYRQARSLLNPEEEALLRTSEAVRQGQAMNDPRSLTPAGVNLSNQAGIPARNLEMGSEPGYSLARWAANVSPEARQTMVEQLNQRYTTQAQRFSDYLRSRQNYPTDALRDAAIQNVRENVYEPAYANAYRAAAGNLLWPEPELMRQMRAAGMMTPEVEAAMRNLETIVQAPEGQAAIRMATPMLRSWALRDGYRKAPQGAFSVVNQNGVPTTILNQTPNGNTVLPSLQYWDYIKRALDRQGTPQSMYWSRTLRDNLDTLVPEYAAARASAEPTKFFNGASDAYDAGRNYILNGQQFGQAAENRLARMTDQERRLFQDGYSQAMIEAIDRAPDRLNIVNRIVNSNAAREEAERALGQQRFRELEARVRVEDIMNRGREAVSGNSKTAQYLYDMLSGAGVDVVARLASGDPSPLNPTDLLYAALGAAGRRGLHRQNVQVARRVAELLMSDNPAQLHLGMQILTRNQGLMQSLRRFGAVAAPLAGSGAGQ